MCGGNTCPFLAKLVTHDRCAVALNGPLMMRNGVYEEYHQRQCVGCLTLLLILIGNGNFQQRFVEAVLRPDLVIDMKKSLYIRNREKNC